MPEELSYFIKHTHVRIRTILIMMSTIGKILLFRVLLTLFHTYNTGYYSC